MTRMREKKLMIKLIMYAHYTCSKMKQAGSTLTVEKHNYMQEYFYQQTGRNTVYVQ